MRFSNLLTGWLGALLLTGLACTSRAAEPPATTSTTEGITIMTTVRVIGKDGKLTVPVAMPKVTHTVEEWRKILTPEQFAVMRRQGTEPAFCGGLLSNKEAGIYVCAGCNLPLYESKAKFESGTGWPSFFEPIAKENIKEVEDNSYGMSRVETVCARCESHLGHVFEDGPRPTGRRYCMNSAALKFVPEAELASIGEDVSRQSGQLAEAVIAGGCFWCVEGVFEELDGVVEAISGYSGGTAETANYEAVCSGKTGHAEAVKIVYDPDRISYEELLKVHFATHDPTTLNRQGADSGPQYRSTIFYANDDEKLKAGAFIMQLEEKKTYGRPIVTTLEPLKAFYPAEQYHQNFVCNNPTQGYVNAVAMPKIEKVRTKFSDMLKKEGAFKTE